MLAFETEDSCTFFSLGTTQHKRSDSEGSMDDIECYNCSGLGHLARDCPSQEVCYNCEGLGHSARECTSPEMCYNCLGEGHSSWECTSPELCKACKGAPHLARDCAMSAMVKRNPECSQCGGIGHLASVCFGSRGSSWDMGRESVGRKTWSSRPVHPSTSAAANQGLGVLKGESLCPPQGPFGAGPAKRGHT